MDNRVYVDWNQNTLNFQTRAGLFSPAAADRGSLAMLAGVDFREGQNILDLGCGYGLVGICAAKTPGRKSIWMLDNDPLAIEMSRRNAICNHADIEVFICSDGPEVLIDLGFRSSFDRILCNPPYHTDFNVARRFIEASYKLLSNQGCLHLVVKRLPWYRNKMRQVFGGVTVRSADGYFVLIAQKRMTNETHAAHTNKTTRKHRKKIEAGRKYNQWHSKKSPSRPGHKKRDPSGRSPL